MNCLSIDIDVLFPCHTYAKYMNYDIDAEDAWEIVNYLEEKGKYGIDTNINKKALFKVSDILRDKCKGAEVVIINEHDEIKEVLEKYNGVDKLYNIDYHHDLTYDNDDSDLNLECWVRHSRHLFNEYHWIHRPLSDLRYHSPFNHYRTCLEDVNVDKMDDIGLVVICISHHFTPINYWKSVPLFLLSYIDDYKENKAIEKIEPIDK